MISRLEGRVTPTARGQVWTESGVSCQLQTLFTAAIIAGGVFAALLEDVGLNE